MTEEQGQYQMENTARSKGEALVEIEQQRAITETQGAMIIAKRFPRDVVSAMDRIANACTRPGLAEAALYEYSRGGTDITGPSIRLAEAIAQHWGNLQFGIRELEQRSGISTIEAFAWDMETNTREIKVFQVAHKRYTKKGTYSLEDPRDIYEVTANAGARRLRACILGIIPGDVVEAAVKQCEATLKTKADVTPERIAGILSKFKEMGVTKAQIETRIQRHLDSITPGQMVNLGKIYNSLKDGMSVPTDWFETQEAKDTTGDLTDKIKGEAPEPRKPPQASQAAPGSTKSPDPESLYDRIKKARPNTSEENKQAFITLLTDNADEIRALPPEEYQDVTKKFTKLFPGLRYPAAPIEENKKEPVNLVHEQPQQQGQGPFIWCHQGEERISVRVCDGCSMRQKCQDYEEHLYNENQSSS